MPGSLKALRLENLLVSNQLTGAQLEAELSDPKKSGAWTMLLQQRVPIGAFVASAVAMSGIAGSPTAMAAVVANASALNAVAASPTAMAAVAASPAAMASMAASSTARAAIYNSDVALTAIAGSSTAISALMAAPNYAVVSATIATTAVSLGLIGNAILVAYSQSTTNTTLTETFAGLRSGTSLATSEGTVNRYNASTTAPAFARVLPLTAAATMADSGSSKAWHFGFIYV
jgi:hypothetical protein